MIAGPDGENPQPVEADANGERLNGDAGPDRPEARQMHEDEGDGGWIDDVRRQGASAAGSWELEF